MKVDPQQLLNDGYIILREVVPRDELQNLRDTFEALVDRQKEIWRAERNPDDPLGGVYETAVQPRVFFNEVVDSETADAAAFCPAFTRTRLASASSLSMALTQGSVLWRCCAVRHRIGAPLTGIAMSIRLHWPR